MMKMRLSHLNYFLATALLLMPLVARADDVTASPPADSNISISVHCGGGSYTTSGERSDINGLLDRVQAFCHDQDKSNLHDDQNPAKDRNCLDYSIKNLSDQSQSEQPGRACRATSGFWSIVK